MPSVHRSDGFIIFMSSNIEKMKKKTKKMLKKMKNVTFFLISVLVRKYDFEAFFNRLFSLRLLTFYHEKKKRLVS